MNFKGVRSGVCQEQTLITLRYVNLWGAGQLTAASSFGG